MPRLLALGPQALRAVPAAPAQDHRLDPGTRRPHQPRGPARDEAQHDPVRHPTGRADRGPGAAEVAGRRQVPAPGVDHLLRPAAPADEREVHDLHNAQQRELDDDPRPPGRPVVLEDGAQHVTPLQGAGLRQRPVARRRGLEVGHRRGRRDDDPGAGDAGPPRQVDVLAEHRDLVVEAPDRGEQVGAHEDAAARDGEDLAGLVVLGLVELPALDPAHRRAEAVHVQAELQDTVRLGLVDELRADDPGVRAHRLFDHHPNGVAIEDDVVVAEQVVGRAVHDVARRVRTRAETGVLLEPDDVEARRDRGDAGREGLAACRIDDERRQVRVVLRQKRAQAPLEPRSRIGGYDDGDDRWRVILRHRRLHASRGGATTLECRETGA